MAQYQVPVSITICRCGDNVIEYSVTRHDPLSGDQTRDYHANREATFHGRFNGAFGRQVDGGATTLWRAEDTDMLVAFRRAYPIRAIRVEG